MAERWGSRPRSKRRQALANRQRFMEQVADLEQSIAERLDRPFVRTQPAIIELLPANRRRNWCPNRGTHRVGSGQRLVYYVLGVVDPDFSGPALDFPDFSDFVGHQLRDHVVELLDESTAL